MFRDGGRTDADGVHVARKKLESGPSKSLRQGLSEHGPQVLGPRPRDAPVVGRTNHCVQSFPDPLVKGLRVVTAERAVYIEHPVENDAISDGSRRGNGGSLACEQKTPIGLPFPERQCHGFGWVNGQAKEDGWGEPPARGRNARTQDPERRIQDGDPAIRIDSIQPAEKPDGERQETQPEKDLASPDRVEIHAAALASSRRSRGLTSGALGPLG